MNHLNSKQQKNGERRGGESNGIKSFCFDPYCKRIRHIANKFVKSQENRIQTNTLFSEISRDLVIAICAPLKITFFVNFSLRVRISGVSTFE